MVKGNLGSSTRGNDGNSMGVHYFVDSGGDKAAPKQSLLRKAAARVLPNREGSHASSMAEGERDKGKSNQRNGSVGSRFSHLNDKAEGEDMDVEGLNADGNEDVEEAVNASSGPGSSVARDTGKKRIEEEVVVACAHPNLVEGLKAPKALEEDGRRGSITVSQHLTKEKALKDVMNKLEPKHAKLKLMWPRVKSVNGSTMREVAIINK